MPLIIASIILSLDQLIKFLVTKNLSLNESYPVIKGVFHLTPVHNTGAAFGILKSQTLLFIFVSLIAVLLIFLNLRKNRSKRLSLENLSLSFILAGAAGNLIDRVSFGYVVDFLDFRVWPVFNLADSAITAGAVLLAWSIIKNK